MIYVAKIYIWKFWGTGQKYLAEEFFLKKRCVAKFFVHAEFNNLAWEVKKFMDSIARIIYM